MKVIVALSGGVDSSVAAALLKEQGHQVEGVFMKNWSPLDSQSLTDCPWEVDQADAEAVCAHLGIPFRSVNFEREYREKVVDYLVREYKAGRTPNPDVLCNKEIKFAAFRDVAESMGADAIATGHYVGLEEGNLVRGVDPGKDQSYFLYTLSKKQLETSLFPVGGLPKAEVRRLAEQFGLPTAKKKDSQGICFIGHLNLKEFLEGEIGQEPGNVMLLPAFNAGEQLAERMQSSAVVGRHHGVAFYTVGEKMGPYIDNRLYKKIRGDSQVPPMFLVGKSGEKNEVYVTDNRNDPALSTRLVTLENGVVTGGSEGASLVDTLQTIPLHELSVQARYQQSQVGILDVSSENEKLTVTLAEPMWGIATGQSLVFYRGNRVVGGGVICATS